MMTKRATRLCLSTFVLAAACGPPKMDGETSPLIETQCEAFCERAITCESEEFALEWDFATQSECLDDCLSWTQAVVDVRMKPSCEAIMGAEWECASTIEECDLWRSYEDDAFGVLTLDPILCQDESKMVYDECST